MKIKFDIEASADELRRFFGWPNVEKLQQELIDKIRENMQAGMQGFDPASLLKPVMPPNLQSMQAFQQAFWETMMGNTAEEKTTKK